SKCMLDALGVWAGIAGEAQAVTSIDITDSSLAAGVRPVLLTYDNVAGDGAPATYIVPNRALLSALVEAVRCARSISVITPAEADAFAAATTGVRVAFADGRELKSDLLVAAEGRASPLREAAGIKVVGWDYPQTGIVTIVRHERPHEGRALQHFLPAG